MHQEQNKQKQDDVRRTFDPGHVMTRRHYEELAKQAADEAKAQQK